MMNKGYLFGLAYLVLAIAGPSGGGDDEGCSCLDNKSTFSGCSCGKPSTKKKESSNKENISPNTSSEKSIARLDPVKVVVMPMREVPQPVWLQGRNYQVLNTVNVARGWYLKKYVDHTRSANLQATVLCNGWTWPLKENPVLRPGQILKICGWR